MPPPFFVARRLQIAPFRLIHTSPKRLVGTIVSRKPQEIPADGRTSDEDPGTKKAPPLARLPTKYLLRSLVFTSMMSQDWLLRPALAAMRFLCHSDLAVLNPDKNPILNKIVRWSIYNHFCAGSSAAEVGRTASAIKGMGFKGVILGYAREVVLKNPADAQRKVPGDKYSVADYGVIDEWKRGTLKTLRMAKRGDILGVKITGAGTIAVDAMKARESMPAAVSKAVEEICQEARAQGSRIWFDAEQQTLQPALDAWAIELMRKHNRNNEAVIYNTIQAYLKSARSNAARHLSLASREGWTLGIKLVRGAYIEHEVRSLIHDTKADTDRSYNDIANMFISRTMPTGAEGLEFPSAALFLATHNAASAEKAISTYRQRLAAGLPTPVLECGQVQGMADELSCLLLDRYDECARDPASAKTSPPGVFKCLAWGSVSECLGYLYRRAIENRGAVEVPKSRRQAFAKELRRRVFGCVCTSEGTS